MTELSLAYKMIGFDQPQSVPLPNPPAEKFAVNLKFPEAGVGKVSVLVGDPLPPGTVSVDFITYLPKHIGYKPLGAICNCCVPFP